MTTQLKSQPESSRNYVYPDKILNVDCLEGLLNIPKHSADIVIADPPYNIRKDFGNDSDKRTMDDYLDWTTQWLKLCALIMKPSATMFIYGFSEILAQISAKVLPTKYHQRWLIWHYTNKNVPSINFWQRSHESILCVRKNLDKAVFNRDDVREPYTDGFLNNCAGKTRAASKGRFSRGDQTTLYSAHPNGALPRDVLTVPSLAGGSSLKERLIWCKTCHELVAPNKRKEHTDHNLVVHPTQKPQELTRRLVLSCRPQNSEYNVLVPFCGSGSECLVVKQLGGNFVSFELNRDYVNLARKSLKMGST